jgi:hypothetical protein
MVTADPKDVGPAVGLGGAIVGPGDEGIGKDVGPAVGLGGAMVGPGVEGVGREKRKKEMMV